MEKGQGEQVLLKGCLPVGMSHRGPAAQNHHSLCTLSVHLV